MTKYKLFNLILKFTQRHVCACALSRLHCCNSFLSGCSRFLLSRLQKVQNSAAKLIFKARKHDYVQPLLQALHWLPVHARIDYNMSTVCHKPFSGSSPAFFFSPDLLTVQGPSRQLPPSADTWILRIPMLQQKPFDKSVFPIALQSNGDRSLLTSVTFSPPMPSKIYLCKPYHNR